MDETTRLCSVCKQPLTEVDERRGRCPHCGQPLLTLTDRGHKLDAGHDAGAYWLWVDPRREAAYNPKTFDEAAFLVRAVALFQSKERWGGQRPAVMMANPAQADNGLEPVAESLGLRVVGDPTVAVGTYRLGLATERKSSEALASVRTLEVDCPILHRGTTMPR